MFLIKISLAAISIEKLYKFTADLRKQRLTGYQPHKAAQ